MNFWHGVDYDLMKRLEAMRDDELRAIKDYPDRPLAERILWEREMAGYIQTLFSREFLEQQSDEWLDTFLLYSLRLAKLGIHQDTFRSAMNILEERPVDDPVFQALLEAPLPPELKQLFQEKTP